jgi:hypothetical protein
MSRNDENPRAPMECNGGASTITLCGVTKHLRDALSVMRGLRLIKYSRPAVRRGYSEVMILVKAARDNKMCCAL